jgi:hypothetical protein
MGFWGFGEQLVNLLRSVPVVEDGVRSFIIDDNIKTE